MKESRGKRRAGFVAVAVASIVTFASLGGMGLAQTAVGLGQYQYGKKVTICHKGKRTIRISVRAWPAHKRHGDTEGACVNGKKRHGMEKVDREHGKSGKKAENSGAGKKAENSGVGKKAEHGRKAETQETEGGKGKSNGRGNR